MIEKLFARASSSARLLEPPLGSYLESLAQTLQGQSYSREVIRSYVYAAHRFGEWLNKQGLPLSAVSDQLISCYIDQFHKRITLAHPYGQRPKLAHGLGHLLVVLRQAGVLVGAQQIPSPTEQWLARYDQYLNQIGVGTTDEVAPPSEPSRPISGTRLSSRWLTFKRSADASIAHSGLING